MHVFRTTLFSLPDEHFTVIVREQDVSSFSEILAGKDSRLFLTHDAFEMPDGDITAATAHAMRRNHAVQQQMESQMALSFFWNSDKLRICAKGGHLVNDLPAPFGVDEVRQVLLQLHAHPNYDSQTIIQHAEDGTMVVLFPNGEVKVG